MMQGMQGFCDPRGVNVAISVEVHSVLGGIFGGREMGHTCMTGMIIMLYI